MTTNDGPVTFLNIFEIPREDIETFKAGWRERIALVDGASGFRGAQLLEAVSSTERFQLVNVTRWDGQEAQQAATATPQLQASVAEARNDQRQRATPNPGFYRVTASVVVEERTDEEPRSGRSRPVVRPFTTFALVDKSAEVALPKGIGAPATRALVGAGYLRLEQLDGVSADRLGALHGVGPKAVRVLREALAERGMGLA